MSRITGAKAADVRLEHIMRRRDARADSTRARLSTGAKINRAADDAAGLAMSVTLKHRTDAFGSARVNAQEAISFMQTKDSYAAELMNMLHRMRELAVRSSTETIDDDERQSMHQELVQIKDSFDHTLEQTYNTHRLFAEFTGAPIVPGSQDMTFQVGVDSGKFASVNTITLTADNIKQIWSNNKARIQVFSQGRAQSALSLIDGGLDRVIRARSLVGAAQNRVDSALQNIGTTIENLHASEGRIRDADFAEETSRLTRLDITAQATIALVSQVRDMRKIALQLL